MRKLLLFVGLLSSALDHTVAQVPKKDSSLATADQPKWKAVWEPANYPKDINLRDVKFVSAEEGWAVGDR